MEKKSIMILSIFIILAIFSIFILGNKNTQKSDVKNIGISGESISKIKLTSYLGEQEAIKDLPKSAKISIKSYNFNNGERQWEKEYKITGNVIKEGKMEDSDISVWIHSKYLEQLGKEDICDVIKQANKNGDLGFEIHLTNKAVLLWKYKNMLKYKKCFGD